MMERGVGNENQGKTLDEIDVELESWNRQSSSNKNENGKNHYYYFSKIVVYMQIIGKTQAFLNTNNNYNNEN